MNKHPWNESKEEEKKNEKKRKYCFPSPSSRLPLDISCSNTAKLSFRFLCSFASVFPPIGFLGGCKSRIPTSAWLPFYKGTATFSWATPSTYPTSRNYCYRRDCVISIPIPVFDLYPPSCSRSFCFLFSFSFLLLILLYHYYYYYYFSSLFFLSIFLSLRLFRWFLYRHSREKEDEGDRKKSLLFSSLSSPPPLIPSPSLILIFNYEAINLLIIAHLRAYASLSTYHHLSFLTPFNLLY